MPTKTRQTIVPADPDDLICDTCPERFPYKGDTFRTFEAARIKGWHIYQKVEMQLDKVTGFQIGPNRVYTRILCPTCIGTPRSKLPPPPVVLEGQADILEDLDVQATPIEKEKNPPKKGVN